MGCSRKCATVSLFSIGTILIILGLILALFWGALYNRIFQNEIVLANNSHSYQLWKETPIPMYLSIYLFNWTNANEVLAKKWAVKPELQQCGPYVFSEHHVRVNLVWNDNGTVTYQQKRIWHFVPELSNGSLSDNITNLNPVVATIGNKVKNMKIYVREAVNLALRGLEHSLIITKTVDELLFKGFNDTVLTIVSKLKIKGLNIPFNKFGWFYTRNNSETYDGTFTIYTGKTDLERVGVMNLWNGEPKTNYYDSYCGDVNGTSGELWPPVKEYREVSIFVSDVCSSLAIKYNSTDVIHGLTGNKYIATDYPFDNGTKYPEQACFQTSKTVPSGVRDISECRFGAPLFVSYPHFYLADPSYQNAVKGLHPNRTEHEMHVTLEPNSGVPLDARAQLQINLFIEPIPDMSMFANVKPTFMPMLWFSQTATLTNKYADMVKVLLTLNNVGLYVGWTAFGIGMLLSLIAILVICRQELNDKEEERLLTGSEEQVEQQS